MDPLAWSYLLFVAMTLALLAVAALLWLVEQIIAWKGRR